MIMGEAIKSLRELKEKEKRVFYKAKDGTEVTVIRTCKLSPHDFAVGLVLSEQKEFNPTHIRLLIDLYIKKLSNPEGADALFRAIEKINSGDDPEILSENLAGLTFPMKFDSPEVNLLYTQLLLIEQDINYSPPSTKKSNLNPPREYTMRYIRWVASGDTQIDRIILGAAGRKYPAPERYSKKMN